LTKIFETQVKNYSKDNYQVDQTTVLSGDGYPVPVEIIYNKHTPRDGTAPAHIYVYGAYGFEVYPRRLFDFETLALLDRGFYFVYPVLRGEGGINSKRHNDGIGFQRKNTADDLIAVSQYLINEKYSSAGKIHPGAASAGCIALGMAVNTHPELFGSATFISSKLDVIHELDSAKNKNNWQEDGNPHVKEEFEYMLSYSPYQNVKKQAYPPIQFILGLKDTNVPPYETLKMAAKLMDNQTGIAPVYLSTDLVNGHDFAPDFNLILSPYIFQIAVHNNILP
jgi:oligopeptidase B